MTREEAIARIRYHKIVHKMNEPRAIYISEALDMAIKALEQASCEMTVEEYRQRMIQAFHNADRDELIAVCVLPTEKEFENLEWLLKNHYKKDLGRDKNGKS